MSPVITRMVQGAFDEDDSIEAMQWGHMIKMTCDDCKGHSIEFNSVKAFQELGKDWCRHDLMNLCPCCAKKKGLTHILSTATSSTDSVSTKVPRNFTVQSPLYDEGDEQDSFQIGKAHILLSGEIEVTLWASPPERTIMLVPVK